MTKGETTKLWFYRTLLPPQNQPSQAEWLEQAPERNQPSQAGGAQDSPGLGRVSCQRREALPSAGSPGAGPEQLSPERGTGPR